MQSENPANLKVVFLGDSGCGKTSIIRRWLSDEFDREARPTVGSNNQRKRVYVDNVGNVDLFVWDTAGQEQFQALMPLYARFAKVAVVTTAINDEHSFEAIPQWINTVKDSCDAVPPLVLAVNKMDIVESAVLSVDDIHERFREMFTAIFFVSALTGENVEQLFRLAAIEAVKFAGELEKRKEGALQEADPEARRRCC